MTRPAPPPPIFRLSKEVTLAIFALCGPPAYAAALAADAHAPDAPPRCLAVSHVCRRWRAYALGDPLLWAAPLLAYPSLAHAMVARTRAAPLDVRYPTHARDWACRPHVDCFPAALYAVLRDCARVRALAVSASSEGWTDLLSHFVTPAPNLCTLELGIHAHEEVWRMPPHILDALAPLSSLFEVICRRCLPDPATPILRCLTSLKLDFGHSDAALPMDILMAEEHGSAHSLGIDELLALLQQTTLLRTLSLRCLLSAPKATPMPTTSAYLPHLQTLQIADSRRAIRLVLASLSVPTNITLDLECCSDHDDPDGVDDEGEPVESYKAFMKRAQRWLDSRARAPLRRATLRDSHHSYTLHADGAPGPAVKLAWWQPAPLTLALRYVLGALPLGALTHLELGGTGACTSAQGIETHDLVVALRRLPQLAALTLRKAPVLVKPLFNALAQSDYDAKARALRVLVPQLRALRVLYCDVWRDDAEKAAGAGSVHRLLGARLVDTGHKLGLLEIDERLGVPELARKKAAERVVRLLRVAERVVVPTREDDGEASEDV
jgi:hypothetical protein